MSDFDEFWASDDLLPQLPPLRPRGLMKWNPREGFWEFDSPLKPVAALDSSPEARIAFATGNFKAMFPDFKFGDLVVTSSDIANTDVFIHLKQSLEHQPIPNGVYVADTGSGGLILRPYSGVIDDYVALPHSVEKLPSDMEQFFNSRKTYDGLGLRHKRGALVYGPPGNGKTFRIMKCASEFVKNFDCLVFTLSGSIRTIDFLQYLSPVVEGRNNIVIIEEITEKASNDLQATLRFLDGDTSWNNSYIIATTNLPERLPPNLIDRPGRFDVLLEVDNPDEFARRTYISHFMGVADETVVKGTQNYSIAYIREMIIRSKLDNVPLESTIQLMKDRKTKIRDKFKGDISYGKYQ